jgi:type II secretory pathway pseudopilin PulG
MEESETHHDRAPLAGVVRELESLPGINKFLGTVQAQRNQRLRQAIGVLVRMIMERRGWRKTGKKGSLGVRSAGAPDTPNHNTGGLAFWFLRAERYEPGQGVVYPSVRKRCRELEATPSKNGSHAKSHSSNGTSAQSSSRSRRPSPRRG